jgi:mRNA interferase MazF
MEENKMTLKVKRGEVYTCRMPEGEGSEQKKDRPVMVIQNDIGNQHSTTTIVAIISSSAKKKYPMHVRVPRESNLTRNSQVFLEQIFTIDKVRLLEKIEDFSTNEEVLSDINQAIKISLAIE